MSLNSLNRSMLRMTGMASGMDTTSMVTSLLKIDQMKVDKQFRAKTTLEWKGDAYRDVNLKLRNFREKYMSVLNQENNVFSSNAYNAFKANYVDETMSKYVGISAGSNAQAGSMSIKSVVQLASAAKAASGNLWKTEAGTVSLDTRLGDAAFKKDIVWETEQYTTTDTNPDIIAAVVANWNRASDAELEAAGITRETGKDYFIDPSDSSVVAYDQEVEAEHDRRYFEFSVNGETFKFTEHMMLSDMMAQVNAKSADTGVTMSYSSLTKGFTFTNRESGADSEIELADVTGSVFGSGGTGAFGIDADTYIGKDAIVIFEDELLGDFTVNRSTNNFAIDGIQYNVKQTFNNVTNDQGVHIDNGERIQFNVERDIEPVFQKIKGFIDGYNSLIEELQGMVAQKPNKDYSPLTEDEKSMLSEKEIEKWEGLAKEGMLYRDSNVSRLLSEMRGAFYDSVQGVGRSASDIGLRTTAYDYTAGGKIVIDEDALKSALMNNPEQVKDIFTKIGKNEDGTNNYGESGLVTRISNAMNSYVSNSTDVTLSTNTRQLREAESRLEQLEQWLIDRENRYWKQFTAMETAMSSMNSQSSWIGNMMGGLGG